MLRYHFSALLFGLLAFLATPHAVAAPRVALVVGNGAYRHTEALPNPANDARAMAAALRRLKFKVLEGTDLDRRGVERLLRDFARELDGAEAALFFYAGHGLEVAGKNYVVPIDAELTHPGDLPFETVDLDTVVGAMGSAARANLIFIDACRNNPLARQISRGAGKDRSLQVGRGLARVDAPAGMLVAFATRPGTTAADGDGKHSPFTEALLTAMETPGVEIRQLMTRVRQGVLAATGNRQQPWDESSLIEDFYLVPPQILARTDSISADRAEVAFWESIRSSNDPRLFDDYLRRFPDGTFTVLARLRLDELRGMEATAAIVTTPPSPKVAPPSPSRPRPNDALTKTAAPKEAIVDFPTPPTKDNAQRGPDLFARVRPISASRGIYVCDLVEWIEMSSEGPGRLRVPNVERMTQRRRLNSKDASGESLLANRGNEIFALFYARALNEVCSGEIYNPGSREGWEVFEKSRSDKLDSGNRTSWNKSKLSYWYVMQRARFPDGERACIAFDGSQGSSIWLGGYFCARPGLELNKNQAAEIIDSIKIES